MARPGTRRLPSYGSKWLWSPNNINQLVIGIKMSGPIGWSLVCTQQAHFDTLEGDPHGGDEIVFDDRICGHGHLISGAEDQVDRPGRGVLTDLEAPE